MTLNCENDLDSVKMNQHTKYLGQRSSSSKVTVRTQTHTHHRLLYVGHKMVGNRLYRRIIDIAVKQKSVSFQACVKALGGHLGYRLWLWINK